MPEIGENIRDFKQKCKFKFVMFSQCCQKKAQDT